MGKLALSWKSPGNQCPLKGRTETLHRFLGHNSGDFRSFHTVLAPKYSPWNGLFCHATSIRMTRGLGQIWCHTVCGFRNVSAANVAKEARAAETQQLRELSAGN